METNAANATAYDARMRLIQRCRRIGNTTCVFIAIYVLGWVLLGSHSLQSPYLLMASSLIASIFAIVVALNVMTVCFDNLARLEQHLTEPTRFGQT